MKRKIGLLFLVLTFIMGACISCSSNSNSGSSKKTLKVGAALNPHTEILEHIKPKLEEEGINLEIVNMDSEDELNPALNDKMIDANYFQHLPYLESVAKEKGYDFETAGKIHIEPMGVYSDTISSLDDLKDGAKIGIPNNPSNEYRALKLLEDNGVIKLKSNLPDYSATPNDIEENPRNIKFIESDAAILPRALKDLTAAVINTNFVIEAGMDTNKAIVRESEDSPYANIVVVRKGDEEREDIKKLIEALTSQDVKDFINENYGGAVVPAF